MQTSITIGNTTIHQDAHGRYSLNDLYRASAGGQKNRPKYWIDTKPTKELIQVLELEFLGRNSAPEVKPIITISTGKPETFVVKELVYAYAMWISPSFHLKVIRAYDNLVNETYTKPNIQHENYWFSVRPHWQAIRELVLQGKTYGEVATILERSIGSVRRAVMRMVQVGLINPAVLASVQKGMAKFSNLKRAEFWAKQLNLAI